MHVVTGLTIKIVNSPPCACHGSSGQKPQYGLMTLAYQRFTAMLLLIYGSFFLSGVYYCLSVFWCAIMRMSELELEQQTNIKLKNAVFWDVVPCKSYVNQRFRGTYRLHLQGRKICKQ
jgi:hypothetical protein